MTQETTKKQLMQPILPEDFPLNLSDFALFLSVMKVKEAYENVLSIVLDEHLSLEDCGRGKTIRRMGGYGGYEYDR